MGVRVQESHCLSMLLSVQLYGKHIYSLMNEPILTNLYTVTVYNLRRNRRKIIPIEKYFNADKK